MADFDLQDFHLGLFYSKVCQFDVKTVEVDAANTFLDVLGKFTFAKLIKVLIIRKGTCLMEFTEKLIYLICCIICNELVPVASRRKRARLTLVVVNDLLEVPWEC